MSASPLERLVLVVDSAPGVMTGLAIVACVLLASLCCGRLMRRDFERKVDTITADLRENQNQLARAGRIAGLGGWRWDIATDTLDWSDEAFEIFGLTKEQFGASHRAFFERVHPDDRAFVKEALRQAVDERQPYDIEHRIVRPNGELRLVRTQGEVGFNAEGQALAMTGIVHDITRFRAAESALRRTRATLATFLQNTPDAVIVINSAGKIIAFSGGAEATFGYTPREVIGRPVEMLIPERLRAAHGDHVRRFAASDTRGRMMSERTTIYGARKNGQEFPAQASLSKIDTSEGLIFGVILRDITRQEAARKEALDAKESAEAASLAKSNFLATMSHEIRTPMNSILGFTSLLEQTPLNDTQSEYLKNITLSGRHLMGLLTDLLDLSRIEAGEFDLSFEPFSPEELIQDVLNLMIPRARAKNIELIAKVRGDLDIALLGDVRRLRQILVNLAGNAVKFTDTGSITITVKREALEVAGMTLLRFDVIDTGIGIAQEDIPRLFSRFSQLDDSAARKFDGAGLGLAICKQLVQAMGGAIGVSSTPGEGSDFWFRVPLEIAEGRAARPRAVNETLPRSGTDAPFSRQIKAD